MTQADTKHTTGKPPPLSSVPDSQSAPDVSQPAAGPHAKPKLTDPAKTPGSGTLPDPHRPQDGDATSG